MAQLTPKEAFRDLKRNLSQIRKRFVNPHLGALSATTDMRLDLYAFVVLAHAEFEHYFEHVSLWLLTYTKDRWVSQQKPSQPLVALALRYTGTVDWSVDQRAYDRIRTYLDDVAVKKHSRAIADNNGTGLDYLESLLCPLGIDVPSEAVQRASLTLLVRLRGDRAHKNRSSAVNAKSPTDLVSMVDDCLRLAETVRDAVLAAR